MELSEARKLKDLERENGELKKMLAEALFKKRMLEAVAEKMVSPAHRRMTAHAVVKRGLCSGRMACRSLLLARATFLYRGQPPSSRQQRLARWLRALREAHPRYDYRRITALLRREGWTIGKRQVQRLRRADGLRVPLTRPKLVRRGVSTELPTKATRRGHVGGGKTRELGEADLLSPQHRYVCRFSARPNGESLPESRKSSAISLQLVA